jgi:hypothetical protein
MTAGVLVAAMLTAAISLLAGMDTTATALLGGGLGGVFLHAPMFYA